MVVLAGHKVVVEEPETEGEQKITETKRCQNCGCIFFRTKKNTHNWHLKKFCSSECRNEYGYLRYKKVRRQRMGFRATQTTGNCKWCDQSFIMLSHLHKFCSDECRTEYHTHKVSLTAHTRNSERRCLHCDTLFTYTRSDQKFCSTECNQAHAEWVRSSKKGGRPKQKADKFKLSVETYLKLTRQCGICVMNKCISIHHIIPKSKGSKDEIENYAPFCMNCHKLTHSGYTIQEIVSLYDDVGIPLSSEWAMYKDKIENLKKNGRE